MFMKHKNYTLTNYTDLSLVLLADSISKEQQRSNWVCEMNENMMSLMRAI